MTAFIFGGKKRRAIAIVIILAQEEECMSNDAATAKKDQDCEKYFEGFYIAASQAIIVHASCCERCLLSLLSDPHHDVLRSMIKLIS